MLRTRRDQRAHYQALVSQHRRNIATLELQQAQYGLDVPLHLSNELEREREALAAAEAALAQLDHAPPETFVPYVGLATFQEADGDRFFGRDALIAQLAAKTEQASFLAVLGPSGSGKSSVVRAGLVPELRRRAASRAWAYLQPITPGARPLDALAAELARAGAGDIVAIRDALRRAPDALLLYADALAGSGGRLVLVVDQAEELWTRQPADPAQQQALLAAQQHPFIQLLLAAAQSPDRRVLVVLTMRADFLHRAAEHAPLARWIADHDVIVSPMGDDEVREAIVGPVAAVGEFEPGLVDALAAQAANQAGVLPLLEAALQELWVRRDAQQVMTWQAFHAMGGVVGALAHKADTLLDTAYTPAQREQLRRVLLRLVQPGEGAADTRRRVALADLVPPGGDRAALQALLLPLVNERLLTTSQATVVRDGQPVATDVVEITHEALIRAWPTYAGWIAASRDDLRLQQRLEEAAAEWEQGGHNAELLWGERRVAQAEEWFAREQPLLSPRAAAFVRASQAQIQARNDEIAQRAAAEQAAQQRELAQAQALAEERKQSGLRLRRRAQYLAAALSLAVIAALLAGLFGIQARQQTIATDQQRATAVTSAAAARTAEAQAVTSAAAARTAEAQAEARLRLAESQRLAFVAQSLPDGQAEMALLVAYEAAARDANSVTERALHTSMARITWKPLPLSGHTGVVNSAVFSPDGSRLLTASNDGTARLWDTDGQPFATLTGHTSLVNSAVFSPDGSRILTASSDGTARLWDTDGQPFATLAGHTAGVTSAVFSPDGSRILTASSSGTARLWDTDGQPLATLTGHTGVVNSAVFSPDGTRLLTASYDKTARLWDTDGQPLATLSGHTSAVWRAVFSPDGTRLLTASYDKTARLWDAQGQLLATLSGHTSAVWSAVFSPDGTRLLTASSDKTARLWDTDGQPLATLTGHTGVVTSAVFSPDGTRLLTASYDKTARLWDTDGQPLATLASHTGSVNSALFSPDGTHLLTASDDKTARLWSTDGQPLATLTGHMDRLTSAVFSPDSARLLTASDDKTARLWDTDGQLLATLSGHTSAVWRAVFSPDGSRILTASSDNTARLWDTDGQPLATLSGHTGAVYSAVFSPDGTRLLTASDDKTARLWDTDGQPLAPLTSHTGVVYSAVFSPDGSRLLTASYDGTARLYLVRLNDTLAVAACLVGRGLTPDEIAGFAVPTPLHLDFARRHCPPTFP